MLCEYCNSEVDNAADICNFCGNPLTKSLKCPGCGNTVPDGLKFCKKCGSCLHPNIYFYLRNDKSGFSFSCNIKSFFDEMLNLLIESDGRFAKLLNKTQQSLDGEYYVLSKVISKKKDKLDAFEFLKNYMLKNGFKQDGMRLIISENFVIFSGSN